MIGLAVLLLASAVEAQQTNALQELLSREIIGPDLSLSEVENYCEARVPLVPAAQTIAEWERLTSQWREDMLTKVVFRGEAAKWRKAAVKVEWLDTLEAGEGYRIRKLRYEALPGLWIPALLYEPDVLTGQVPVSLNVNGHDPEGKAARYKQVRCIHQAKHGMLALNPEWLGMGQLRSEEFQHYRMNQLDLCGTSGLAPFYLALERGLDVLLAHPSADPRRVAVSGLSGGGWQTIFISALDPRVTLSNPVAGYSSFRTRVHHHSDLGDSEQTPCDMATVADYSHLTALLAPRATLLTYNVKDDCCFASGHALQPLLDAAEPAFKLYRQPERLRSHVNFDPGTHNFDRDNRQALYRLLATFFYPDSAAFATAELPCEDELMTKEELAVELPVDNENFQTLAAKLSQGLPRAGWPDAPSDAWSQTQRERLAAIVRTSRDEISAEPVGSESQGDLQATFWKLRAGGHWTIPAVELSRGETQRAALLVADAGRTSTSATVERLLREGYRVVAVDPFYTGESKIKSRDFLFALLVSAVGDRPVGLQASQLTAISRWLKSDHAQQQVTLVAEGERMSLAALVAAALEREAIDRVELSGTLGSLKQVIEQGAAVNQKPELFCFGLLEAFDLAHLIALIAPRDVHVREPSARAQVEFAGLKAWYAKLGRDFDVCR